MPPVIPIQETPRPILPVVLGCRDYNDEQRQLERIDRILTFSGVEQLSLSLSMESFEGEAADTRSEGDLKSRERVTPAGPPLHGAQASHWAALPAAERRPGPDPALPLVLRMSGL